VLEVKNLILKGNKIVRALLEILSPGYLIKQGIPAIIENEQIKMRSVYGLNIFLSSWLEEEGENDFIIYEISKFLEKFDDYLEYSGQILKFIHDKGRSPEKDEAWDLSIPIDEMDFIMDLINVKIKNEVFSKLSIAEKKYFDMISKPLILSKNKIEEFRLEEIITKYSSNLIDAKILPQFINDLLNLDDLNKEIERYLSLPDLSSEYLNKLNKYATNIIKLKLLEKKELTLLDLARKIKASIMETGESLYYINNSTKIIKKEYTKEEIEKPSEKLAEALRYCHNYNSELNLKLLITQFELDLRTANEIITLYNKQFTLPEHLSRQEIMHLDQISRTVIKYIKEVNEKPTIDDLMINLNLNIRDASVIFTFINKTSSEPLEEDFKKHPEKFLLEIDDLSCEILMLGKNKRDERDLIDLAHLFDTGIYAIKLASLYISWIGNQINNEYIANLTDQERKIVEGKIKSALKYIKDNKLDLEFRVLIKDVGFNLKDTHLILNFYNDIISREINVENFTETKKNKIEALTRKIYSAKKNGKIISYDPEDVFLLNIDSASLEEFWEALVYLKIKVLNLLMGESRLIKTDIAKISSEGSFQLKERHATKVGQKQEFHLSKETIKLQETKIKFKETVEKVQLKRGVDFVGGLIRYKVAIKNNTEMLINNLEVSLQMTADHIRIADIKPKVYKKNDRAKIPNMSPGQSESIDFYLEPMICGSIPVIPITTYIDAFGKPKMITKKQLMVVSKCPPIINPGEENIAKVKNIYESNDIIRSFRTFELEHDPRKTFHLLMEAIGSWAGKSVSNPIYISQEPFFAVIYYYILNQNIDSDLGHREQIIIKIQVDEERNIAMLNIGAEKNPTVNGVLTHVWQLANSLFGESFGYSFISLHCPECGGSLDNINKSQENVICKYCGEKFEKKALK